MQIGISNIERKRVKNLVNYSFNIHQCSAKPELCLASCSNRREKHRMTFANIVEGCLLYNFRIYRFCRKVQIFGETRSQSRVDQLKYSSVGALERRRRAGRPAGLPLCRASRAECCAALASVRSRSHRLEPRAAGPLSRPPPMKACCPCCAVLARSEMSRGPLPVPCTRKLTPVVVPRH
jgi:hypothetical protein